MRRRLPSPTPPQNTNLFLGVHARASVSASDAPEDRRRKAVISSAVWVRDVAVVFVVAAVAVVLVFAAIAVSAADAFARPAASAHHLRSVARPVDVPSLVAAGVSAVPVLVSAEASPAVAD